MAFRGTFNVRSTLLCLLSILTSLVRIALLPWRLFQVDVYRWDDANDATAQTGRNGCNQHVQTNLQHRMCESLMKELGIVWVAAVVP